MPGYDCAVKRILPFALILIALVIAVILSRRAPQPVTSGSSLSVVPLVLSGAVEAPTSDLPVRVSATVNGANIADSAVKDGQYRLELPARVPTPSGKLSALTLLHGEGRLEGSGAADEVQVLVYQDANRNAAFDAGEPKLEPVLLPAGRDANLRAYFRYKILLLSEDANLTGSEDNPSGAKDFYRYAINAKRGYNILQGEFASNGFEMTVASGADWDLLTPLPAAGGTASPPAFTP